MYLAEHLKMAFVPIVNPDGVNLIEQELSRKKVPIYKWNIDYLW